MASSQLEFAGLLTLLVKYVGSESMPVLSKPETQLSLHKHGATKEAQECLKSSRVQHIKLASKSQSTRQCHGH